MVHAERPPHRRRHFRDAADRTSIANTRDRFLTRAEVEQRTGLTRSMIYRLMAIDEFPRPYRVGLRAVRWSEREVSEWAATRPRAYGERKQGNGDAHDTDQKAPADDQ